MEKKELYNAAQHNILSHCLIYGLHLITIIINFRVMKITLECNAHSDSQLLLFGFAFWMYNFKYDRLIKFSPFLSVLSVRNHHK